MLINVFVVVGSVFAALRAQFQLSEPVVCDSNGPAAVHEAVSRLEVAVQVDCAIVQIDHALSEAKVVIMGQEKSALQQTYSDNIPDQGCHEYIIQMEVLILQHILCPKE